MDVCPVADGVVTIPLPVQLPDSDEGRVATRTTAADERSSRGDFVIGPENRLVEVVFQSVLAGSNDDYNPIVLHGPSGTGKTHLARGLAEAWKSQCRRGVCYLTGSDFARQLANAVETHGISDFRQRNHAALLWVLDDVGLLTDKIPAQEELLFTLDAQLAAGHRVLITTRMSPFELPGLLPGLRSRLVSGLAVGLAMPGLAARQTLLARLAEQRGMNFPEAVLRHLAETIRGPVPELTAALSNLEMASRAERRPVDLAMARAYLAEQAKSRVPGLSAIAAATAKHFAVRVADLRSASRRQAVVRARGVAMYLARLLTPVSLQQIGHYFGGRDHTTVLHACRKTESLLASEPAIHKAVMQLRQQFPQVS